MMRAHVRDRLTESNRRALGPGEPHRNPTRARVIVHVDMDAFFAAIEERDNPALRGKPVIVGGPKGSRGVVTTANYVARGYGVGSGMSLAKAERLCPDAVHISTKGGKYTWVSLQIMEIMRRFSPEVEPYSVDEAFLDGSGCAHLFGGLYHYGAAIKRAILDELELTASVGIGPSRVVAKMASGMNKPDGLTVIEPHRVAARLGPLPVGKIPGVGPTTEQALKSLNINMIRQLVECPRDLLEMKLGKHGDDLANKLAGAEGIDRIGLEQPVDDKSKGHEHTFHRDVTSRSRLLQQLLVQCEMVSRRMRRDLFVGRRVTLKLRTHDFRTRSHQRVTRDWTDDPVELFQVARGLLDDIWREEERIPVRLVGVSVSGLIRPGEPAGVQEDLFLARLRERRALLFRAVDDLRDRYGENIVGLAAGYGSRRSSTPRITLSA